jgi:hypothetical protein
MLTTDSWPRCRHTSPKAWWPQQFMLIMLFIQSLPCLVISRPNLHWCYVIQRIEPTFIPVRPVNVLAQSCCTPPATHLSNHCSCRYNPSPSSRSVPSPSTHDSSTAAYRRPKHALPALNCSCRHLQSQLTASIPTAAAPYLCNADDKVLQPATHPAALTTAVHHGAAVSLQQSCSR